ncbi:ATP-dependent endonuclease [Paracoccus litorisediminis]
MKKPLQSLVGQKKVRFISAGRMGKIENYRSDYDGHRGSAIDYEQAEHGSKRDVQRRHLIETLDGDFQTLSERIDILIKVRERLRKLFKRDIIVEWDAGHLKVAFARLNSTAKPYSSGREASGLLHLVGILSALYDDEVGALLIDEPEVSLHPQLQSFLLKEIVSCSGHPNDGKKIVAIATHSTEFIQINKPEDLSSLIFSYDVGEAPIQISPDASELKGKAIVGLVARLGQEHKLALFAKRPLLVEGPSDVIITSGLANKQNAHLEAAGSQLLPVVGKGQLPVVAKLLRMMGKEPVVMADADGIADGLSLLNAFFAETAQADEKANLLGASSATDLAKSVYSDFCKLVESDWEVIREHAESHYYWLHRDKEKSPDQAKRRAAFSILFKKCSDTWLKDEAFKGWRAIRERFDAVLNLAEASGLFVLRRGTIESYYQSANPITSVGKPNAAATELQWIYETDPEEIEIAYADVMRCIRFAANVEEIREADALRDIVLAIAAPAQAKLHENPSIQDLQLLNRSTLGDRSQIFDLALENGDLIISLKSKILNVNGFPIRIRKDDNVGGVVKASLAPRDE